MMFPKVDSVCDAFWKACEREHVEVTHAKSKLDALDLLQSANVHDSYNLLIIDARNSKFLDAEDITR